MDKISKGSTKKQDGSFSRSEKIFITACMAVIAVMLVAAPHLPDSGPELIRKKLTEAGYNVEDIEFTLLEEENLEGRGRIYQASASIEYAPEVFVDQWQLVSHFLGKFVTWHTVTPYPEIPENPSVCLQLIIPQEDYDQIRKLADGESVEEYISRLIYERIGVDKAGK